MYLRIILAFIFVTSCALSPGFQNEPSGNKAVKNDALRRNGVTLHFYDINKMNVDALPRIDDIKKKTKKDLQELTKNNEYDYKIGAGDVINISITDNEDIDGSYTVSPQGDVTIPYVGQVLILDKTKEEAQQFINEVLKNYYKEPETIVKVEQYKSSYVYITGSITKPISILLSEQPLKILDGLIQAGYIKSQASYKKTALLRRGEKVFEIDLYELLNQNNTDLNIYLKKEDVLHVAESDTDNAYAFGEFTTSGPLAVYKDLTLTEMLATKGINKATAKTKAIYVMREDVTKFLHIDIFKINLENPAGLVAANKFFILPNDIVYIPNTKLVKWNAVISLLTPSESLFKTYKPYIKEDDNWYIENSKTD